MHNRTWNWIRLSACFDVQPFLGECSGVSNSFHLSDTWWNLSSLKTGPYQTNLQKCGRSILPHSFSPPREGHWNTHVTASFMFFLLSSKLWKFYEKGTLLLHKCLYIYVPNISRFPTSNKSFFIWTIEANRSSVNPSHRAPELSWGCIAEAGDHQIIPVFDCHLKKSTANRRNYSAFYLQCSAYYSK